MKINVTPLGKPRMTRSDKWKVRDVVVRYRMFKDALRREAPELQGAVDDVVWLVFVLPMPPSWSQKKRIAMVGTAHRQKPDVDNMEKAFLDATMKDDCSVYETHNLKMWGEEGAIYYGKEDYATMSQTINRIKTEPSPAIGAESLRRGVSPRVAGSGHLRLRDMLPGTRRR